MSPAAERNGALFGVAKEVGGCDHDRALLLISSKESIPVEGG